MDERQKESDDYWKGKRFLSDKAIAGKLIMEGNTEATQQDFIDIDNMVKANLSPNNSDYWRKNLEETGKTMAGFYGSFDSSMIKEEDLTDENGERYKKYTTNVFGKKSLIVRKNKPIVPANNMKAPLPNVVPKPNQIQPGQIPVMNAKLGETVENMATASQVSNDMPNNLPVNENLQNLQTNIFNHVPIGPDNIENLMKENIKEAKRLKNLPLDGLEKFKGVSSFDQFKQEKQYFAGLYEKYLTFYERTKTHGIWDYKDKCDNTKFEDFGNFHYGVVGAAAGIPDWVLLGFAGVFHMVEEFKNMDVRDFREIERTGKGLPFISENNGDDPKDQEQIKAGIEWYKTNKGHFE
jgi:hypothetical protein